MTTKKQLIKKKKTIKKRQVGRPPIFNSAGQLQTAIEDFFKNGVRKKTIIVTIGGKKIPHEIEYPTITGLCYHIGFESRQAFYDLEKNPIFSYTIKRARLFIEGEYELLLASGNVTGAIFALKNFGWSDKSEMDIMSGGEKIQQQIPSVIVTLPPDIIEKLTK